MLNIIIRKSGYSLSSKRENVVNPLDMKDGVISQMYKDKTMLSMIRSGKGSDKGLVSTVECMERERASKRKDDWMTNKKKVLAAKKQKYGIR